ncbi:hypothetical protein OKJ48_13510 [Streptomyces kunmingensis]|uniref:Uncharacterized protein n=1 Tax=Streptomyces kunmingensis TaxID=68225 RepID=A0ABU6C9F4_9ACTN|nr:hypothetical protein [Streptomyces kunmingensis]MEB3961257.1 hypothetical protein [Streptomyces kunmingensis]
MSTLTLSTPRNPAPVPRIADVFDFACTQIHQAATILWSRAEIRVGDHVPSVTGYVVHLSVNDRLLYGMYSYLGMSLVWLLRGAGGSWPQEAARSWRREVLVFWLVDTANLLSTVLSAPPGLPLNERTRALAERPLAACSLLDRASAAVHRQQDTPAAWHEVLTAVRGAVT